MAQVAIDNAKRRFDVDLNSEIDRIKKEINVRDNGYPEFWGVVKKPKSEKNKRGFNKKLIKYGLKCPMNYLSGVEFKKERSDTSTLPMSYFFISHEMNENRRKSKKIEDLITNFSLQILSNDVENCSDNMEEYLLERDDFDALIQEISGLYVSTSYAGLMSWLIDRAFCITVGAKRNKNVTNSTLNNNKSVLMKVLYTLNPIIFLSCFTKNAKK